MPGASGLHRGFTEVLALHCSFIKDLGLDSSTIRALELPTVASSGPWGLDVGSSEGLGLDIQAFGLGSGCNKADTLEFCSGFITALRREMTRRKKFFVFLSSIDRWKLFVA